MPDIEDPASGLAAVLDFIIMLLGLVKIGLDKAVLSKKEQRFGGRAGLNLAMMVAEYGIVMGLFVKLNIVNQNWMHAASIMMSFKGDMDISANMYKQTAITETRAASPTAGLATSMIVSMGKSFAAQSWWKILLESIGAAALLGGAGAGLYYGYKHSSSDNTDLRDELEALYMDINDEVRKKTQEATGSSLDPETEASIKKLVTPLITSIGAGVVTAIAAAVISKLAVTNIHESDVSGDKNLKPSETETTVSKAETAASETEGKLSKDGVSAQEGDIKANETEAKASTGEATAAENGAQALRTKAGASDIEAKALKIT